MERDAWPVVVDWLKAQGFRIVQDVRGDPDYQASDIDLIVEDTGIMWTAEVKVRTSLYGDLALETLSCREKGTPGYLYASKANLLVYVFYVGGRLHPNSSILALSQLRAWFERNKHRYRSRLAPNPPGNPLYHSVFFPVPFRDLPKYLFYPRGPCK